MAGSARKRHSCSLERAFAVTKLGVEVVIVSLTTPIVETAGEYLAQPGSSQRHGAARLEADAQLDEPEEKERRHSPVRATLEWPRFRHVH